MYLMLFHETNLDFSRYGKVASRSAPSAEALG